MFVHTCPMCCYIHNVEKVPRAQDPERDRIGRDDGIGAKAHTIPSHLVVLLSSSVDTWREPSSWSYPIQDRDQNDLFKVLLSYILA